MNHDDQPPVAPGRQARLRVVRGPGQGTYVLEANRPFVVGRSREATLAIEATGVSRLHFELIWDGSVCQLRDLNSRYGVRVNGHPVSEAILRHGDQIEVGDSRFAFDLSTARRRIVDDALAENAPAATVPSSSPALTTVPADEATMAAPLAVYESVLPTMSLDRPDVPEGTLLAELIRVCALERGEHLYTLIDGAQAFELAFTARLMGARLYTLFTGALAVDLAHVGPCLAELTTPEPFLEQWVRAAGTHAGVLLRTRTDLATLYHHLRKIFVVTDEEGQEYFFRYYDPRVLRVFLPTCTDAELKEFFGPLDSFVAESEDGKAFQLLGPGASKLIQAPVTA